MVTDSKTTKKDESGAKKKIPRHRSPNFPSINLGKALEKADQLFRIYKMTVMPERAAHEAWENAAYGSQALLTVAALKAFGLIETEGSAKERKIQISENARLILLDDDNKNTLLKDAALLPPIHREIWDHFDGFIPKKDDDLRKYLLIQKKFNEKSVDHFIAQFRATIDLTKLEPTPKIGDENTAGDKDKPPVGGKDSPMGESLDNTIVDPGANKLKVGQPLIKDYSIPRKGQKQAILRLEYPVTQEDIEQIEKWLKLMGSTLEDENMED